MLLEGNRRGEEVFWHMCQVRSLEANVTLWERKDAFYITPKSTCVGAGAGLELPSLEDQLYRIKGEMDAAVERLYLCRCPKAAGKQGGFGTLESPHGSRAEELLRNMEFGVSFMP